MEDKKVCECGVECVKCSGGEGDCTCEEACSCTTCKPVVEAEA